MANDSKELKVEEKHHLRFHLSLDHLLPVFGSNWFANKAEQFARFFGTPIFLSLQTLGVIIWIAVNLAGKSAFDPYPFILLNLAFSLQSAYAAPLILLAQTRQADRDKALSEADASHREALAQASLERLSIGEDQARQLLELLETNTELTRTIQEMSQRIEKLTRSVYEKSVDPRVV